MTDTNQTADTENALPSQITQDHHSIAPQCDVGDDINKKQTPMIECECQQPNEYGGAVPVIQSYEILRSSTPTGTRVNKNTKRPSLIPVPTRAVKVSSASLHKSNTVTQINKNPKCFESKRSKTDYKLISNKTISVIENDLKETTTIINKKFGIVKNLNKDNINCLEGKESEILKKLYINVSQMKDTALVLSNTANFKDQKVYIEKLFKDINDIQTIAERLEFENENNFGRKDDGTTFERGNTSKITESTSKHVNFIQDPSRSINVGNKSDFNTSKKDYVKHKFIVKKVDTSSKLNNNLERNPESTSKSDASKFVITKVDVFELNKNQKREDCVQKDKTDGIESELTHNKIIIPKLDEIYRQKSVPNESTTVKDGNNSRDFGQTKSTIRKLRIESVLDNNINRTDLIQNGSKENKDDNESKLGNKFYSTDFVENKSNEIKVDNKSKLDIEDFVQNKSAVKKVHIESVLDNKNYGTDLVQNESTENKDFLQNESTVNGYDQESKLDNTSDSEQNEFGGVKVKSVLIDYALDNTGDSTDHNQNESPANKDYIKSKLGDKLGSRYFVQDESAAKKLATVIELNKEVDKTDIIESESTVENIYNESKLKNKIEKIDIVQNKYSAKSETIFENEQESKNSSSEESVVGESKVRYEVPQNKFTDNKGSNEFNKADTIDSFQNKSTENLDDIESKLKLKLEKRNFVPDESTEIKGDNECKLGNKDDRINIVQNEHLATESKLHSRLESEGTNQDERITKRLGKESELDNTVDREDLVQNESRENKDNESKLIVKLENKYLENRMLKELTSVNKIFNLETYMATSPTISIPQELISEVYNMELSREKPANHIEVNLRQSDSMDGIFIPSGDPPNNMEDEDENFEPEVTVNLPEIKSLFVGPVQSCISNFVPEVSEEAVRSLKKCPKEITLRMDFIQGKLLIQPPNNPQIKPNLHFSPEEKMSELIIKPSTECSFKSEVFAVDSIIHENVSYKSIELRAVNSRMFSVINLPTLCKNNSLNPVTKSCGFLKKNSVSMEEQIMSMPEMTGIPNEKTGKSTNELIGGL